MPIRQLYSAETFHSVEVELVAAQLLLRPTGQLATDTPDAHNQQLKKKAYGRNKTGKHFSAQYNTPLPNS